MTTSTETSGASSVPLLNTPRLEKGRRTGSLRSASGTLSGPPPAASSRSRRSASSTIHPIVCSSSRSSAWRKIWQRSISAAFSARNRAQPAQRALAVCRFASPGEAVAFRFPLTFDTVVVFKRNLDMVVGSQPILLFGDTSFRDQCESKAPPGEFCRGTARLEAGVSGFTLAGPRGSSAARAPLPARRGRSSINPPDQNPSHSVGGRHRLRPRLDAPNTLFQIVFLPATSAIRGRIPLWRLAPHFAIRKTQCAARRDQTPCAARRDQTQCAIRRQASRRRRP